MTAATTQSKSLRERYNRMQNLCTELYKHNPGTAEFHAILNDILHVREDYNKIAQTIIGIIFSDL